MKQALIAAALLMLPVCADAQSVPLSNDYYPSGGVGGQFGAWASGIPTDDLTAPAITQAPHGMTFVFIDDTEFLPPMSPVDAYERLPTIAAMGLSWACRPGMQGGHIIPVKIYLGGPKAANPGVAAIMNVDGSWSVDWARIEEMVRLTGSSPTDLENLLSVARPLLRTISFERGDEINTAAAATICNRMESP